MQNGRRSGGMSCGYYTMTAEPEWYNAMFFGCPREGREKRLKANDNGRFAVIISYHH